MFKIISIIGLLIFLMQTELYSITNKYIVTSSAIAHPEYTTVQAAFNDMKTRYGVNWVGSNYTFVITMSGGTYNGEMLNFLGVTCNSTYNLIIEAKTNEQVIINGTSGVAFRLTNMNTVQHLTLRRLKIINSNPVFMGYIVNDICQNTYLNLDNCEINNNARVINNNGRVGSFNANNSKFYSNTVGLYWRKVYGSYNLKHCSFYKDGLTGIIYPNHASGSISHCIFANGTTNGFQYLQTMVNIPISYSFFISNVGYAIRDMGNFPLPSINGCGFWENAAGVDGLFNRNNTETPAGSFLTDFPDNNSIINVPQIENTSTFAIHANSYFRTNVSPFIAQQTGINPCHFITLNTGLSFYLDNSASAYGTGWEMRFSPDNATWSSWKSYSKNTNFSSAGYTTLLYAQYRYLGNNKTVSNWSKIPTAAFAVPPTDYVVTTSPSLPNEFSSVQNAFDNIVMFYGQNWVTSDKNFVITVSGGKYDGVILNMTGVTTDPNHSLTIVAKQNEQPVFNGNNGSAFIISNMSTVQHLTLRGLQITNSNPVFRGYTVNDTCQNMFLTLQNCTVNNNARVVNSDGRIGSFNAHNSKFYSNAVGLYWRKVKGSYNLKHCSFYKEGLTGIIYPNDASGNISHCVFANGTTNGFQYSQTMLDIPISYSFFVSNAGYGIRDLGNYALPTIKGCGFWENGAGVDGIFFRNGLEVPASSFLTSFSDNNSVNNAPRFLNVQNFAIASNSFFKTNFSKYDSQYTGINPVHLMKLNDGTNYKMECTTSSYGTNWEMRFSPDNVSWSTWTAFTKTLTLSQAIYSTKIFAQYRYFADNRRTLSNTIGISVISSLPATDSFYVGTGGYASIQEAFDAIKSMFPNDWVSNSLSFKITVAGGTYLGASLNMSGVVCNKNYNLKITAKPNEKVYLNGNSLMLFDFTDLSSYKHIVLEGIDLIGSSVVFNLPDADLAIIPISIELRNCKIYNNDRIIGTTNQRVGRFEMINSSVFKNGSSLLFRSINEELILRHCSIFSNNGSAGVRDKNMRAGSLIRNCVFFNNNGHGFKYERSAASLTIQNCIFASNSGYAICEDEEVDVNDPAIIDSVFYNNGGGSEGYFFEAQAEVSKANFFSRFPKTIVDTDPYFDNSSTFKLNEESLLRLHKTLGQYGLTPTHMIEKVVDNKIETIIEMSCYGIGWKMSFSPDGIEWSPWQDFNLTVSLPVINYEKDMKIFCRYMLDERTNNMLVDYFNINYLTNKMIEEYNFNGTNNNSVTGKSAILHNVEYYSNSIVFNHSNDYVALPLSRFVFPKQGTISIKVFPTTFTSEQIIFSLSSSDSVFVDGIKVYMDNEDGVLNLGVGSTENKSPRVYPLMKNIWSHLVFIWDDNNYRLYVDGEKIISEPFDGFNTLGKQLILGNNFTLTNRHKAFLGRIDDVKIYNYPLSQDQVSSIYHFKTNDVATINPKPSMKEMELTAFGAIQVPKLISKHNANAINIINTSNLPLTVSICGLKGNILMKETDIGVNIVINQFMESNNTMSTGAYVLQIQHLDNVYKYIFIIY